VADRHPVRSLIMRAVLQRVTGASVTVDDEEIARIGDGLLVFLGVGRNDGEPDAEYMAKKCAGLRVFERNGKLDLSVVDTNGEVLAVPQFTLYGDCRRGRRPSFDGAAFPDRGRVLFERFVDCLREQGIEVKTGRFGSMMQVEIHNDGPVTVMIDSEKVF